MQIFSYEKKITGIDNHLSSHLYLWLLQILVGNSSMTNCYWQLCVTLFNHASVMHTNE